MANSQVHYSERTKPLIKLLNQLACRHGHWEIFSDFLLMAACSISNTVDPVHRDERERQYMETVKKYSREEINLFSQALAELINAMQRCTDNGRLEDILGMVFHELELYNKYKGQFFTPQPVSDMMGLIAAGERRENTKGYETVCEPCIGSGTMVLGFINAIRKRNGMPVVVTGVDVDLKCVHMAYLQLSLYGIPAVVIHGNSLTCEEWSRWYTPVYIAEGWIWRERCGITDDGPGPITDEKLKLATEPMYAAFRAFEGMIADMPQKSAPASVCDIKLREENNGQTALF